MNKIKLLSLSALVFSLFTSHFSLASSEDIFDPEIEKQIMEEGKKNAKKREKERKVLDEFVFVEGGTFQMGSNEGEEDEKPLHNVKIDSFYIGKYEVTQKEYQAVMGTNPSYFRKNNLPVEQVSFNDAVEFCNKYNKSKGLPNAYDGSGNIINWTSYRLPTEAEWEYAAKGGNKSKKYKYSGSNTLNGIANFCDVNCEYDWKDNSIIDSYKNTSPVGSFRENELGIYDMSGNVWEWVSDWYDENYYNNSNENINPYNNKLAPNRVNRGGSWLNNANNLRIFYRNDNTPMSKGNDLGFRIARSEK